MKSSDNDSNSAQDNIFLSVKNSASQRFAIFEDDGASGWLYLTGAGERRLVADCFVYSRVPPVERIQPGPRGKEAPPLLTRQFASDDAVRPVISEEMIQIQFTDDGESVAVLIAEEPWGFIASSGKRGYSRSLSASGPFGNPWDEELFRKLFQR